MKLIIFLTAICFSYSNLAYAFCSKPIKPSKPYGFGYGYGNSNPQEVFEYQTKLQEYSIKLSEYHNCKNEQAQRKIRMRQLTRPATSLYYLYEN